MNAAGNPTIQTLAEAMDEALSPDEQERLEAYPRPLVESGGGVSWGAVAFVWAVKR